MPDFALRINQAHFVLIDVEVVLLQLRAYFLKASIEGIVLVVKLFAIARKLNETAEGVVGILYAVVRRLFDRQVAALVIDISNSSRMRELIEGVHLLLLFVVKASVR